MPVKSRHPRSGRRPARSARLLLLALALVLVLTVAAGCPARKPVPQTGAITPAELRTLMTSVEGQAAFREAFVTMYKTSEGRAAFRDVMADLFTAPDTAPVVRAAMVDGLRTVPGQAALVQALGSVEARPTLVSALSTVLSGSSFRSMIRDLVNSAVASMMPKTPAPTPTTPGTGP
ncbi:MAG: hypothetical protein ACYC6I_12750 [Bacillota bacterium]